MNKSQVQMENILRINQIQSLLERKVKYRGKIILSLLIDVYMTDCSQRIIQAIASFNTQLKLDLIKLKALRRQTIKQQLFTYHSLALIFDISNNPAAQQYYELGLSLSPANPQLLLCYARFLYHRGRKSALKYLQKIQIQSAIIKEHRQNVGRILKKRIIYINQNLQFRSSLGIDDILKQSFSLKSWEFSVKFYSKAIHEDRNNHEYYIDLAMVLIKLNRREQTLQWIQILEQNNPRQWNIIIGVASIFQSLEMFKESIPYYKKAISIYEWENLYQSLIHNLIMIKDFRQAKYYAKRLIQTNKKNYNSYYSMGFMLSQDGKYAEAIQCAQIALSLNNQHAQTYRILGFSYLNMGKVMEAAKSYTQSARIFPHSWSLNELAFCQRALGHKLNAIECNKKALLLDYADLISYLFLSKDAQQNDSFKSQINQFMEELKQRNPSKLHVEFNVSLYYYISKQSFKFNQHLICFLDEEKNKQDEQKKYSDIITKTIKQYQRLTPQFRQSIPVFQMIMGILSKAKGNLMLSHQCFTLLSKRYKKYQTQSAQQVFDEIYINLLMNEMKESTFLFLEYLVIQIFLQNPKEGLRCYLKAVNYYEDDYNGFKFQLKIKIQNELEKLNCISDFFERAIYQDPTNQLLDNTISNTADIINLHGVRSNLQRFIKLTSAKISDKKKYNLFENDFGIFINQTEQNSLKKGIIGNALADTLTGLHWNELISKQYNAIYFQINQSEQKIMKEIQSFIKVFSKIGAKEIALKAIMPTIQNFKEDFIVNQKIKLLFNSLFPFIICETEEAHRQFSFILFQLKNNPLYDFYHLKRQLSELFRQNREKNIIDQQSELSSMIFEENETSAAMKVYRRQDTESQYDSTERQSMYFINQTRERHRKYSDTNIKNVATDQKNAFIKQITVNKNQEKIIKAIFVPYEKQQQISYFIQSQEQDAEQSQSQIDILHDKKEQFSYGQISSQLSSKKTLILKYSIDSIKFPSNQRLYFRFKKILVKNFFSIVQYLSKNNNKSHIAKHYLGDYCINNIEKFDFEVEEGDKIYYQYFTGSLQDKTAKWIWFIGAKYVLKWIVDIALGIIELEELGIYQADLAIRNTIKVSRGNWFSFKIIDFDTAFKVVQGKENDKTYQFTKQLIDHWLRFSFEEKWTRIPYDECSINHFQSSQGGGSTEYETNIQYDQTLIIRYIFRDAEDSLIRELLHIKNDAKFSPKRLPKCLKLLRDYKSKSHLKQYVFLVRKLLSYEGFNEVEKSNLISTEVRDKISKDLFELEQSGDYIQFIQQIKKVGNLISGANG